MEKEDNDKLTHERHTLAHLLAAAVLSIYPDAKPAIGPATDTGFYYDFEFSTSVGEKDLEAIEGKMREILPTWKQFLKEEKTQTGAKNHFEDNPYKHELIDDVVERGEPITFYTCGSFTDLCRGGHSDAPSIRISAESFRLDRVAGAYWRGDEKNKMLTRVYGLAFATKAELDDFVFMRAEAKRRDHKRLGQELDLFHFSETVGKGLPLFTRHGATIRRELERFVVDEEIKRGYQHVSTPDLAKLDLYIKSGHYPYYKDSQYSPIDIDGDKFMLRPMTCPHHFEIYLRRPHSYRELPVRIAELAQLYRYEQSGELSGLIRLRTFTLADAHIICTGPEQAVSEIGNALDLIEYMTSTFGLIQGEHFWYRLSLGDRAEGEKYYKDDSAWDMSEDLLRKLLLSRTSHFVEAHGEAAFYGPKIDIQMRNVSGKEDTAFTVQYDFSMPKRFGLQYDAVDGTKKLAVVVHRSSIGCIERVMAFLIEHFAGEFPLWLAPIQVAVLPVGEAEEGAGSDLVRALCDRGLRAEMQVGDSLGKRIHSSRSFKIPYIIVLGRKEIDSATLTIEKRTGEKVSEISRETFIEQTLELIKSRSLAI